MSWRPENNGDVDREGFNLMMHNQTSVQEVLLYIFRHKKKVFRKEEKSKKRGTVTSNKIPGKGEKWNVLTEKSEDVDARNKNNAGK